MPRLLRPDRTDRVHARSRDWPCAAALLRPSHGRCRLWVRGCGRSPGRRLLLARRRCDRDPGLCPRYLPRSAQDTWPVKQEREQEALSELSLPEALSVAIQLHRAGHLEEAEIIYRRILEIAPDQSDALHFLGVLSHRRGRSESAIELIERSIAIDPSQPDRYNNLGNVFIELGRLSEATDALEHAIALEPAHADAYNNLGAVLKARGRLEEAAAAYQKAIDLNPNHVNAYNNFGNLLSSRGLIKEAVAYYCKAITLMPNHPQARKLLGIAYYSIGQID